MNGDSEVFGEVFYFADTIIGKIPRVVAAGIGTAALDLHEERRLSYLEQLVVRVENDPIECLCVERGGEYTSLIHEAEENVLSGFAGQPVIYQSCPLYYG